MLRVRVRHYGKILDDILMMLDRMDLVLFEQKLSAPCPGKWLERDVPPMLCCEFVRCLDNSSAYNRLDGAHVT